MLVRGGDVSNLGLAGCAKAAKRRPVLGVCVLPTGSRLFSAPGVFLVSAVVSVHHTFSPVLATFSVLPQS